MLKVQIETTMIDVKNGVSPKTGKPYSIREQEAWVQTYDKEGKPHRHPQKFKLTLDDDQPNAYPLGDYIIDPASIYIDRFGQLAIRARLRASLASAPAQPKAA